MDDKIREAASKAYRPSAAAHCFQTIQETCFVVVDWKGYYNNQEPKQSAELCCDIPVLCKDGHEVGGITVNNPTKLSITFDLMGENALHKAKNDKYGQCETIAYPKGFNNSDEWVLMIEMKYVNSIEAAVHDSLSYPNKMISQIKDTALFLRDNSIIQGGITVYAAIAFPKQDIDAYKSFLFMRLANDFESLFLNYNIYLRLSNSVQIVNRTELELI